MISPTARPLNHTLGVVSRNMEVEQLSASNKENLVKMQNLESDMSRLKSDLEEEVNSIVSKNLVESINT